MSGALGSGAAAEPGALGGEDGFVTAATCAALAALVAGFGGPVMIAIASSAGKTRTFIGQEIAWNRKEALKLDKYHRLFKYSPIRIYLKVSARSCI